MPRWSLGLALLSLCVAVPAAAQTSDGAPVERATRTRGELLIPAGFGGRAEAAPPADAAPVRRRRGDLIVPAGFAGGASVAGDTDLIVPEIFRSAATAAVLRAPEGWERAPRRRGASELRIPEIFREVPREASFEPRRVDDGPRVPEAFREPRPGGQPPIHRARDELCAPGFDPGSAPPARAAPPAEPDRRAAPGLGRRLDAPAGR